MPILKNIQNQKCINILGLMSGTSCDGLDMALVKVCGSALQTTFKIEATKSDPYPPQLKSQLLDFISKKTHTLKEISQFNFYMAKNWAGQIKQFIKENELDDNAIELIASHGQTIWHQPEAENFFGDSVSSTLQLGDPSVLATLLNIPVVGDFRLADMALGGQGAPLIPYFDWVFFSQFKKNILALNIGGISNISFIPENGDFNDVIAFDCGPGNMLIDSVTQKLYNKPFDTDGKIAASGKNSESLFSYVKKLDTFSETAPPKSTGRELYNDDFVKSIMHFGKQKNISAQDIIHTLAKYTAYSIFTGSRKFIKNKISEIAIAGGGAKNNFILKSLEEYFENIEVKATSHYGLNEDFKEAAGFAILGNETIRGNISNVPSATGAKRPTVLGKICLV